jgi:hypothetical protein
MATDSAIEKAAQVWCKPETSHIVMDTTLALAFAETLDEIWSQPWLGNATTKQLREELAARGPDSPDDYKTFDPARDAPNG